MKIRIAITDDHPMMLKGLQSMIRNYEQFDIVASYPDGTSLLEGLKHIKVDVLLLDVHLPDITGDDLTRTITKRYPEVRIVILTSHDSIYFIKTLTRSGAKGYILKSANQEILVQAIEMVHSGETFYSPEVKDLLVQDALKQRVKISSSTELTDREKEIIQLIAEECTSNEIAEKLHLSPRTVENYRLGLLHKLDAKNMVGLIKKAMQLGLIE